ncbi:Photosynthetic NDH subunit of lumenal location 3 chloroplastic [Euphorbia peplus]|nr:Photosynthetic NDH subunit of lumenal location 3 chloroplastic [Euphorbia peplus]
MAQIAKFNGIADSLPAFPKISNKQRINTRAKVIAFHANKQHQSPLDVTRRLALGLASIFLTGSSANGVSLAEDNGFWRTDFPLDVTPRLQNKIANDKTGTRSFLKKGLFIPDIGVGGSMYRIKRYAFDLLAMEDLIGPDTLNYVRRYLRLKSTSIYYDFDKVISAAPEDDKPSLMTLANRLFDNFEELEEASRKKNLPRTQSSYQGTKVILQEVMDRMPDI